MNVSLSFTNRLQDPSLCVTVVTADIETHHSTEPFVPHRRQPLGPLSTLRNRSMNGRFRRQLNHVVVV
ncbi:hypothetical protein PC129_g17675 [Phytophthora cactorum]|nr:hypothetical protein PC111_g15912 [Phytophthora cactorum]KAG2810666.1 hypothetical protein PC112_g15956 [Phytophthora cactorum]KAG2846434.1 hypothetical protein PC113_g17982 [Phytophthora cactorum]KAG2887564.1 hypothetical protein PC114_g18793 [Phytophthora cactorum]KAG2896897.1 hypothetical protein PC115_g17381 [Phytophthora cactorum]